MNRAQFDGKVVLITGGAAGIGRATAERFAAEGATAVVWDLVDPRRPEDERVDVSDEVQVAAAMARLLERHGRIDVLVNNAGITRDAQLVKWKDEAFAGEMALADFEAV